MKNQRILLVFILSLAFLLTSSVGIVLAGQKMADTKSSACCPKDQQKACCPSGDKAKCDPAQCKTGAKCDPAKCDPAQCKTGAKCDPAQCKTGAKCDPAKCSTAKTCTKSAPTGCPHSQSKDKKDPSGT